MKDKIVRFHHKAPYYLMRRALIFGAFFLLLSAIVLIPLGITIYDRAETNQVIPRDKQ